MRKVTIFSSILKLVNRSKFKQIVADHKANKWRKSYQCWDHFVALVYQQISGKHSLRSLITGFNIHQTSYYHLGLKNTLKKSTFSDANSSIPCQVFSDLLSETIMFAKRKVRKELQEMIRLIDATPIQLRSSFYGWAKKGHRITGLKCHTILDPVSGLATHFSLTDANINDITPAQEMELEPGATYVFDKAYCGIKYWNKLGKANCRFVTRLKKNTRFEIIEKKKIKPEASNVISDEIMKLTSDKGRSLEFPMRKIIVLRAEDNKEITIGTNDLNTDASEVAELYKTRWQIEVFFKWLKQNLKIKRYIGHTENAVKNQIYVALITYTLIFIYKKLNHLKQQPSLILLIIKEKLFSRRSLLHYLDPSTTYVENINLGQGVLAL